MPDRTLPDRPNLEQYKKQAKELVRDAAARLPAALERVHRRHPRFSDFLADKPRTFTLADAQLVLAREHGFDSWPGFAKHIETLRIIRAVEEIDDPLNTFIEMASVDRHGWHAAGTLEHANLILSRYPEVATANIYSAAVLGDASAVRTCLAQDRSVASTKGGPRTWDALTYLCFSRYLRIDKARSESFVDAARALLQAGANPDTGWTEYIDTPPRPLHESVIYAAAGIARNPEMTKLLLEFGADPNDEETPYHVPETYDNSVVEILLDSGRLNSASLSMIAVRKCDWHDDKGLKLALEYGTAKEFGTAWMLPAFHHSIRRDNGPVMIEMFLDRGVDPYLPNTRDGRNAVQMAAWQGRDDILTNLEQRGFNTQLDGLDALVAACARANLDSARDLIARDPDLLRQMLAMGGGLLARFSGTENAAGIRCLFSLGVSPGALWPEGDNYWEMTPGCTALHFAAWRAHHEVVQTLIAAGTPVNARDARDRTALQLAVRACTDSYWKSRRKPDSVAALLAAGAVTDGIEFPTGYDAIDALLIATGP